MKTTRKVRRPNNIDLELSLAARKYLGRHIDDLTRLVLQKAIEIAKSKGRERVEVADLLASIDRTTNVLTRAQTIWVSAAAFTLTCMTATAQAMSPPDLFKGSCGWCVVIAFGLASIFCVAMVRRR